MEVIDVISRDEMVRRYCERQEATPEDVNRRLDGIVQKFGPTGFFLAECQVMDSSRIGELVILPYGGAATFPVPPEGVFSPRGLASDMSVVVAVVRGVR